LNALPSTAPLIVLDTNVLLDWLVFLDPQVRPVVQAVQSGQVTWLATRSMQEEMERVLTYQWISARSPDLSAIRQAWAAHARFVDGEAGRAPIRCKDPDDQKFIDLAVAAGARWLLSKDRELLKLARRAARLGVVVQRPQEWQPASALPLELA
jgi:putative PIN family toxin of toxin-antitoxin system